MWSGVASLLFGGARATRVLVVLLAIVVIAALGHQTLSADGEYYPPADGGRAEDAGVPVGDDAAGEHADAGAVRTASNLKHLARPPSLRSGSGSGAHEDLATPHRTRHLERTSTDPDHHHLLASKASKAREGRFDNELGIGRKRREILRNRARIDLLLSQVPGMKIEWEENSGDDDEGEDDDGRPEQGA